MMAYTPLDQTDLNSRLQNTHIGQQLAAWLYCFNTGDAKSKAEFVHENYAEATPQAIDEIIELSALTGGLALHQIDQINDTEVVVIAKERYSLETGWREITCRLDPAVPHCMQPVQTRPVASPAGVDERVGKNSLESVLQTYLDELATAGLFSGVVQVVCDQEVLFELSCGLAHQGYDIPNHLNTKFNVGSINKMFTAVAVAQLVEDGRLRFNDPLTMYVDQLPRDVADRVTIHQLLTHTAGMGNSILDERTFWAKKDHMRAVNDWLTVIKDAPLASDPGSQWLYSNRGFLLLGAVIEKITDQSYFDYVRTHVFEPAAMHNTDFYELDIDVPNRATGYLYKGLVGPFETPPRRNNLAVSIIKGSPHGGGGGYSTASDLVSFAAALKQHRLLSPPMTNLLLKPKTATGRRPSEHYAYGFFADDINGGWITGHGGTTPGFNAWFDMYQTQGYVVAVLSNYDAPTAQRVGLKLRRLLA